MKFIVSDRESIERGIVVRSSYVLISIRDPDRPKVQIPRQAGLRDVLRLAFHDAEPSVNFELPPQITLMTPAQARKIWAFVERHHDIGAIVVHCEQGMSRSPAVAAAICRGLGGDDTRLFQRYQPNRFVYQMLLDHRPAQRKEP